MTLRKLQIFRFVVIEMFSVFVEFSCDVFSAFSRIASWDKKADTWAMTEILRTLIVNLDYRVGLK